MPRTHTHTHTRAHVDTNARVQSRTTTTAVAVLVLPPPPFCRSAPLLLLPLVVSVVVLVASASAVKTVDVERAVVVVARLSGLRNVGTPGWGPASAAPPVMVKTSSFAAPWLDVPAANPSPAVKDVANVVMPVDSVAVPTGGNALEATVFSGVPIASVCAVGLSAAADGNVELEGRTAAELVPGGFVKVAAVVDGGVTVVAAKAVVLPGCVPEITRPAVEGDASVDLVVMLFKTVVVVVVVAVVDVANAHTFRLASPVMSLVAVQSTLAATRRQSQLSWALQLSATPCSNSLHPETLLHLSAHTCSVVLPTYVLSVPLQT